jgi:hypothetical protein
MKMNAGELRTAIERVTKGVFVDRPIRIDSFMESELDDGSTVREDAEGLSLCETVCALGEPRCPYLIFWWYETSRRDSLLSVGLNYRYSSEWASHVLSVSASSRDTGVLNLFFTELEAALSLRNPVPAKKPAKDVAVRSEQPAVRSDPPPARQDRPDRPQLRPGDTSALGEGAAPRKRAQDPEIRKEHVKGRYALATAIIVTIITALGTTLAAAYFSKGGDASARSVSGPPAASTSQPATPK